jgi:hypothetical protein
MGKKFTITESERNQIRGLYEQPISGETSTQTNPNVKRYVSRQSHINTINNQYMLSQGNLYFTIEGNKIFLTNKDGTKKLEEYTMGDTKKGDQTIRYSFNNASEGTTGKDELVRRSLDNFTNKSSKIVYELIPLDK